MPSRPMPKAAQNPQADPDLHRLPELAPLLRQRLLDWWEAHGITCSMSAKGCCWDSAVVESLFSTLKHEL